MICRICGKTLIGYENNICQICAEVRSPESIKKQEEENEQNRTGN